MGIGRLVTVAAILVLNLVGILFLESKMEQYATLELVAIVVGIILSVMALIGIVAGRRWAWPFVTILFSLMLANLLFVYMNVGALLTFVLLLIINIGGMLIAVLSIHDAEEPLGALTAADAADDAQLATYASEEPEEVVYKTAPIKKKQGRKEKR